MEDRTAILELVAVLTMTPPAHTPSNNEVYQHFSRRFPALVTTAAQVKAAPPPPPRAASQPATPPSGGLGAPPSAWAGQVSWTPPKAAPVSEPTGVSGSVFLDNPPPTGSTFLNQAPDTMSQLLRRNLETMAAESGTTTPGVRTMIDAQGVSHRLPPEGAVNPQSRQTFRPTSPPRTSTTTPKQPPVFDMASPTRTAGQDVADTVVFGAANILLAVQNNNNGDPDFDPAASQPTSRGRSPGRMTPLVARPVPWTPAAAVEGPLQPRSSTTPRPTSGTATPSAPTSASGTTTPASHLRPDYMFPPARPASSTQPPPTTSPRTAQHAGLQFGGVQARAAQVGNAGSPC